MKIIGIDPGLANTGFGIIEATSNSLKLVSYGCISTSSEQSHELRLLQIYNELDKVIKEFKPDVAEMETLYFARNISSALSVSEAKGVVTLLLAQHSIPIHMYTPNQIKYAVTGSKSAEKDIIQFYVKTLLKLKEVPKPDHASDALAGAITFVNTDLGKYL